MYCAKQIILLVFTLFFVVSANAYNTAYGCENQTLKIECNEGEFIQILNGNYGRTNPLLCKIQNKPYCASPNSNDIIKKWCNLKRTCTVPATNEIFGDPCIETTKYAEAQYTCSKNTSLP